MMKTAISFAATEDQIAATLGRLAASSPHRSAGLRARSQAAASRATRMRQWARDQADTA